MFGSKKTDTATTSEKKVDAVFDALVQTEFGGRELTKEEQEAYGPHLETRARQFTAMLEAYNSVKGD